jgi:hypothetical protein
MEVMLALCWRLKLKLDLSALFETRALYAVELIRALVTNKHPP